MLLVRKIYSLSQQPFLFIKNPPQMQDMDDNDSSQQYLRSSKQEGHSNHRAGPGQRGFVVADAPWTAGPAAAAPNTASNEEFPSFGDTGANSGSAPLWGPRR